MEFKYLGMTFIYHPKTNKDGYYFEHKLSGHGFYTKEIAKEFNFLGRPSKKRAAEIVKKYVESSPIREGQTKPCRLLTMLSYKKQYPENI